MLLTKKDKKLIKQAKSLAGKRMIKGGYIGSTVCVLVTGKGRICTGVNLEITCGIGFCAEHTAVGRMITKGEETYVKTIVSADEKKVRPPCGRCRELLNLLDKKNLETEVIVSENKKVKLGDLLPYAWQGKNYTKCKAW